MYDGKNAFIKKLEGQKRGFIRHLEEPHKITDPIIARRSERWKRTFRRANA